MQVRTIDTMRIFAWNTGSPVIAHSPHHLRNRIRSGKILAMCARKRVLIETKPHKSPRALSTHNTVASAAGLLKFSLLKREQVRLFSAITRLPVLPAPAAPGLRASHDDVPLRCTKMGARATKGGAARASIGQCARRRTSHAATALPSRRAARAARGANQQATHTSRLFLRFSTTALADR